MMCQNCPNFETTAESFPDAQVELYRHTQTEHPTVWAKFMDWVLN
jgi:CHAT domain-containing protein